MKKSKVHFENIEEEIKAELLRATASVKICVAWFSFSQYKHVIHKLRGKGVRIELICNLDRFSEAINPNEFDEFHSVRSYLRAGLMHHKFCIIDDSVVITGSYNWSRNAINHLENIIVLYNDFDVIKAYLHQFDDIKMLNDEYHAHNILKQRLGRCHFIVDFSGRICRSTFINIIVGSLDEGRNCRFAVWRVCLKNHHAKLLEEFYEEVIDDGPSYEREDEYYCKEEMLSEYQRERKNIEYNVIHHGRNYNHPIHALAYVDVENWHEHLEYGEDKKHYIKVYWKNLLYRKEISDSIYIESIVNWAQPT
ncbi:phospholipase D-like domain-containing protein [Aeromonas hydrophila]|uniref:phospholipase D-like domain-containing protein n=1 Tax=Aeromonas hydrophila TaxID=644 RepID=UPI0038D111C5